MGVNNLYLTPKKNKKKKNIKMVILIVTKKRNQIIINLGIYDTAFNSALADVVHKVWLNLAIYNICDRCKNVHKPLYKNNIKQLIK